MLDFLKRANERIGRGARILVVAVACAMAVAMAVAMPQPAEAANGTSTVYRMYNPWSHEHFYTTSSGEKATNLSLGWRNEGVAWTTPASGEKTIYRLKNPYTDEHLYTADPGERDSLESKGWNVESPLGAAFDKASTEGKPVYRLYNPWNSGISAHHYTADEGEKNSLASQGWKDEGVQWRAAENGEQPLAIGAFFVDRPDLGEDAFETVLCATRDGYSFTTISTPFKSNENPFHDPSIMYKDGWFYMLSNMPCSVKSVKNHFYPMISYSRDLKEWSEPEGLSFYGGSDNGIPLESAPFGLSEVDDVAAEWFLDDNGDVYIIFSSGYYGAFHGEPEHDQMKPYAVKVEITHEGLAPWRGGLGNKNLPLNLQLKFTQAFEIKDLDTSDNYIDGSMYKENGKYYLLIKKDGQINQIYENSTMGPNGWHKVKDNLSWGNEGPSLMKFDGAYMLYTDQIATTHGRTGIQVSASTGIDGNYSNPQDVSGLPLRHGTVINLTGDAKTAGENLVKGKL